MNLDQAKPWVDLWNEAYAWPGAVSEWLVACALLLMIFLFIVIPAGWIYSFVERKLGADLAARIGPNRSGPWGLFQPLSDFLKLISKRTASRGELSSRIGIVMRATVLFASLAVLPVSSGLLLINSSMSVFLPLLSLLMLGFVSLYFGMMQFRSESVMGALRSASQTVSGFLPALLSVLAIAIGTGSFRWSQFHEIQGFLPHEWALFSGPFSFLAFLIFVISGVVILGVPPLDAPYSRVDLSGGLEKGLGGQQLVLNRAIRFFGFLLWSICAVALFLGGWNLPEGLSELFEDPVFFFTRQVTEVALVLFKAILLMVTVAVISRVTPRIRVDQVTRLSWIFLTPFALAAVIGSVIWVVVRT